MIRKAILSDLDGIMDIVKATVEIMNREGNYQWNAQYPVHKDFASDIENGSLYVYELDSKIAGFMCVDSDQPAEYEPLEWTSCQDFLIVHRAAISPDFRKRGIATKLLEYAEEIALSIGASSLRTDTSSENDKMNALFKKLGYEFRGLVKLGGRDIDFSCYEKILK